MKPTCLALLALALPALAGPALAARPAAGSRLMGGYMDILVAEAVGEFRPQSYDAYRSRDGNEVFVGTQKLDPKTLLAAGLGLRLVFVLPSGLRFSGEGSLQGGRRLGDSALTSDESGVLRGELLLGLGYQVSLGPLVLHAAGILGGDYSSLKLAPTQVWSAAASLAATASPPGVGALSEDVTLKRWGLRLGAQAGAHVQVSKLAALYGDVTFDYDGQWRTRIGLAFGDSGRR